MKYLYRWGVLLLLCGSLWAAPPQARTKRKASATKRATAAPAVTADDIRLLREALATQQQQIEQLRKLMESRDEQVQQLQQRLLEAQSSASAAQTKLASVEGTATQQKEDVNKLQSEMADVKLNMTNSAVNTQEEQKRVSAVESLVNRFRFTGDVRIRQEDFFQEGTNARIRERIRLRFGVESKLNEDFVAGIFVASGAITDPTSTNETLTNAFERKSISFDRGYITYQPKAHPWLQLTGGKFAYTWTRTAQTFDSDLNPEGFSERFSFDTKHKYVKNVTFTGMQLLFNEVAGPTSGSNANCVNGFQFCANGLNRNGADSFAVGGQVSAKVQFGRLTLTPSYSLLNWRNTDVLMNEAASVTGSTSVTTVAGTTTPTVTLSSGPLAPNGLTNATVRVGTAPNGAAVLSFASRFLYSDLILDSNFDTGIKRFPARLTLEYLDNLNAVKISPVLGRQSHLYKGEFNFGQLKNRNDVQFGYGFWRQEQDSVISSLNESDQRAPTNIVQHVFSAQWLVRNNVTAAFTLWNGRTLNSNLANARLAPGITPGQTEPYLQRMQFDLIYKF